jgi:hypothetical protein
MLLSEAGFSIRMNQIDPETPRFNTNQIERYINRYKDPRPWQYLKWRQERSAIPKEAIIKEMMNHLNFEMKKLNGLLEGNK